MQAVLLAAGASSRVWPLVEGQHKGLFRLLGKPLVQWTVESLARAGADEVVVVQGPDEAVARALDGAELGVPVRYAVQAEARGMGHALLQAEPLLRGPFVLMHPYHFDAERFLPALAAARDDETPLVLSAQRTDQPQHYGILALEGDRVRDLVEKPDPGKAPSDLRAMGVYLLEPSLLDDVRAVPEHQYAFEDALLRRIRREQVRAVAFDHETPTLKHPWDALRAARLLLTAVVREPFVHPEAQVDPTALVKGNVHIGPGARVFEHAVVKGPCYLGANCVVGTGSLVREHCVLEEGVVIGAHCEVARSVFGAGATTHSGFFGDSIFGPGAKAGAGTITANVRVDRKQIFSIVKERRTPTGLHSLGAIVGAGTALGIQTKLMPGVLIGANCLIGPGEIVSGSVPSGSREFSR